MLNCTLQLCNVDVRVTLEKIDCTEYGTTVFTYSTLHTQIHSFLLKNFFAAYCSDTSFVHFLLA
jgi:hypothetical protein